MTPPTTKSGSWDAATERYTTIPDVSIARWNADVLTALRPAWEQALWVITSMFTLRFTAEPAGTYGWGNEYVEVLLDHRTHLVEMRLLRVVARRSDPSILVGPVVVTADRTRPDRALPAIEALLYQLSPPRVPPASPLRTTDVADAKLPVENGMDQRQQGCRDSPTAPS